MVQRQSILGLGTDEKRRNGVCPGEKEHIAEQRTVMKNMMCHCEKNKACVVFAKAIPQFHKQDNLVARLARTNYFNLLRNIYMYHLCVKETIFFLNTNAIATPRTNCSSKTWIRVNGVCLHGVRIHVQTAQGRKAELMAGVEKLMAKKIMLLDTLVKKPRY